MAIRVQDRYQSMDELMEGLYGTGQGKIRRRKKLTEKQRRLYIGVGAAAGALCAGLLFWGILQAVLPGGAQLPADGTAIAGADGAGMARGAGTAGGADGAGIAAGTGQDGTGAAGGAGAQNGMGQNGNAQAGAGASEQPSVTGTHWESFPLRSFLKNRRRRRRRRTALLRRAGI